MKKYILALFSIVSFSSYTQNTNFLLGKNFSTDIDLILYDCESENHTSFKPIIKSNISLKICL